MAFILTKLEGMPSLLRKLRAIERSVVPLAVSRGINRTTTTVRAEASRDTARAMGLKVRPVRKSMRVQRASTQRLFSLIIATGRKLSLRHFAARHIRKGVSHKAYGRRQLAKGAFMARGKNTDVKQVFARRGPARLPIRKLFGPAVPETLAKDNIMTAVRRNVRRLLPKRIKAQFKFEVARLARRRG